MAISVTFRGVNYSIPEPSDAFTQSVTDYLNALASGAVPYPTTADIDFGSSFGVKALYIKSRTANPATAGLERLASGDAGPTWRNAANSGNVSLAKDSADALTWGGAYVTGNPMLEATSAAGQVIASGATTTVVFGTTVTDSDSAYNAATGQYTVPAGKGGDYLIASEVDMNSTQAGAIGLQVFKNGVLLRTISAAATQTQNAVLQGACVSRLVAGDIIDVRVQNTGAGGQTLIAAATATYFNLKRIP